LNSRRAQRERSRTELGTELKKGDFKRRRKVVREKGKRWGKKKRIQSNRNIGRRNTEKSPKKRGGRTAGKIKNSEWGGGVKSLKPGGHFA